MNVLTGASPAGTDLNELINDLQSRVNIVETRISLSQNFFAARDEPYEEGSQTNKITAPQGKLLLNSAVLFGADYTLTLANGLNSDLAIGTAGHVVLQGPTGAFSVGGLSDGADGRLVVLVNITAQTLTIVNEDASSAAANRIRTNTAGTNVALTHVACLLIWDQHPQRWNLISG